MNEQRELVAKATDLLKEDLNPEEQIVWAGEPVKSQSLMFQRFLPIFFALAGVLVVSLFFSFQMSMPKSDGAFMMSFLLPGVFVVGFIMIVVFASSGRDKILYALSNQRAFSMFLVDPKQRFFFKGMTSQPGCRFSKSGTAIVQSAKLEALPPITEVINADGSGTVALCFLGKYAEEKLARSRTFLSADPFKLGGPVFGDIPDAHAVAEKVRALAADKASQKAKQSSIAEKESASMIVRPPRDVPFALGLQLLACGRESITAWIICIFVSLWSGSLLTQVLIPSINWGDVLLQLAPNTVAKTEGKVLVSDKGKRAVHHLVEFQTSNNEQIRTVVTSKNELSGNSIPIEYPASYPNAARIAINGEKSKDRVASLLFLFIPLSVAGSIAIGIPCFILWRLFRTLRLLQNGKVVVGRAIEGAQPCFYVNRVPVLFQKTYEYTVNDKNQFLQQIVNGKQVSEEQPLIFYDPNKMKNAVCLNALPGSPTIDARGQIQAPKLGKGLVFLLLPLVVLKLDAFFVSEAITAANAEKIKLINMMSASAPTGNIERSSN